MSATKILWGQLIVVSPIALAFAWAATVRPTYQMIQQVLTIPVYAARSSMGAANW